MVNSRAVSSTVRPAAGAQVERDVAGAQERGLDGALVAQARAHAREQLLEAERLGHVVVGAALEPGDLVADVVAGGEDHDRHSLARGAQLAQHRRAVLAGQPEVEDQQVELVVARHEAGGRAVGDDRRGEAVGAEALLEEG
jgi:hypothetical protein